jgi:hypothetical protein
MRISDDPEYDPTLDRGPAYERITTSANGGRLYVVTNLDGPAHRLLELAVLGASTTCTDRNPGEASARRWRGPEGDE